MKLNIDKYKLNIDKYKIETDKIDIDIGTDINKHNIDKKIIK
jgi:hypothetical protein